MYMNICLWISYSYLLYYNIKLLTLLMRAQQKSGQNDIQINEHSKQDKDPSPIFNQILQSCIKFQNIILDMTCTEQMQQFLKNNQYFYTKIMKHIKTLYSMSFPNQVGNLLFGTNMVRQVIQKYQNQLLSQVKQAITKNKLLFEDLIEKEFNKQQKISLMRDNLNQKNNFIPKQKRDRIKQSIMKEKKIQKLIEDAQKLLKQRYCFIQKHISINKANIQHYGIQLISQSGQYQSLKMLLWLKICLQRRDDIGMDYIQDTALIKRQKGLYLMISVIGTTALVQLYLIYEQQSNNRLIIKSLNKRSKQNALQINAFKIKKDHFYFKIDSYLLTNYLDNTKQHFFQQQLTLKNIKQAKKIGIEQLNYQSSIQIRQDIKNKNQMISLHKSKIILLQIEKNQLDLQFVEELNAEQLSIPKQAFSSYFSSSNLLMIKKLYLANNRLQEQVRIQNYPYLTELDLSKNKINKLYISNCQCLIKLNIYKIRHQSPKAIQLVLDSTIKLQQLYASIINIQNFYMPSLRKLQLLIQQEGSINKISSLCNLEYLDLKIQNDKKIIPFNWDLFQKIKQFRYKIVMNIQTSQKSSDESANYQYKDWQNLRKLRIQNKLKIKEVKSFICQNNDMLDSLYVNNLDIKSIQIKNCNNIQMLHLQQINISMEKLIIELQQLKQIKMHIQLIGKFVLKIHSKVIKKIEFRLTMTQNIEVCFFDNDSPELNLQKLQIASYNLLHLDNLLKKIKSIKQLDYVYKWKKEIKIDNLSLICNKIDKAYLYLLSEKQIEEVDQISITLDEKIKVIKWVDYQAKRIVLNFEGGAKVFIQERIDQQKKPNQIEIQQLPDQLLLKFKQINGVPYCMILKLASMVARMDGKLAGMDGETIKQGDKMHYLVVNQDLIQEVQSQ